MSVSFAWAIWYGVESGEVLECEIEKEVFGRSVMLGVNVVDSIWERSIKAMSFC